MNKKLPDVWEILSQFKDWCKSCGWKTCDSEDWIQVGADFHNLVWARDVHLSSFRKIVSNRKCVVRQGLSYQVVEASHEAWLFSETPSEDLTRTILEDSEFLKRIAVYDLSLLARGKNACIRLNETDSPVFQEFESFLKKELKIRIESLQPCHESETDSENLAVSELT